MEMLLHMFLFVLGAILGSFYIVAGLRVPEGESIVAPRSHCPDCQTTLTSTQLIPIFSYIFQKGKCRNCKTKISPIYPIFESITAFLFTISPLLVGWSKELPVALALISLFVIITITDLKTMLIPDKVLLVFFILFIILRTISPLTPWWDSLVGGAAGFIILFLLAVVSKGGMGGGDIKLFGVIGIVLGFYKVLLTLFFSSLIGAIFGLNKLIKNEATRKSAIPFGPFIAVGALISYFFGNDLLDWYIGLL